MPKANSRTRTTRGRDNAARGPSPREGRAPAIIAPRPRLGWVTQQRRSSPWPRPNPRRRSGAPHPKWDFLLSGGYVSPSVSLWWRGGMCKFSLKFPSSSTQRFPRKLDLSSFLSGGERKEERWVPLAPLDPGVPSDDGRLLGELVAPSFEATEHAPVPARIPRRRRRRRRRCRGPAHFDRRGGWARAW